MSNWSFKDFKQDGSTFGVCPNCGVTQLKIRRNKPHAAAILSCACGASGTEVWPRRHMEKKKCSSFQRL